MPQLPLATQVGLVRCLCRSFAQHRRCILAWCPCKLWCGCVPKTVLHHVVHLINLECCRLLPQSRPQLRPLAGTSLKSRGRALGHLLLSLLPAPPLFALALPPHPALLVRPLLATASPEGSSLSAVSVPAPPFSALTTLQILPWQPAYLFCIVSSGNPDKALHCVSAKC